MIKPADYMGKTDGVQGRDFKPFKRVGYTVICPLPFLNGQPWDEIALAYVHALRPSRLRVVTDGTQLDFQPWRVTVWLSKGGFIERIQQEVAVGLPEGIEHGHALNQAMSRNAWPSGNGSAAC